MLRFFYSPGSCALASHVALEESGLSYTAVEVNLHKGDNDSTEYRAINPLGRVPALDIAVDDFRLRGPGVNKIFSTVGAVGTKTVTVRLGAGRYQFLCQPHAAAMHGAFSVR